MKLSPWRNRTAAFDSLFDNLFDLSPWAQQSSNGRERFAPVNIFENEQAYVIEVELPGVDEKDVEVKLNGDELTVTAERKHDQTTKNGDFHRVESHYGRFSRTVRLPEGVLTDSIGATFKRGVLTLTAPKAPERTPTRIEVKAE